MSDAPLISVIIPVHNGSRTLRDCLSAVRASDYANYEIVIVDDRSTDDSRQIAESFGCRVVAMEQNIGAARSKNQGAAVARGDILFFTDADVCIQPDTLSRVAHDLADGRRTGVVGLLGTKLPYDNFSSQFKNLWMHYTYRRQPDYVGLFYTSAAAIRAAVFREMGGFDENYAGASITEDIELGQRLLTAGHKIYADKALTVEHLKHYTLGELLRTDFYRAAGLTRTWVRKKLQGPQEEKYYASVPWFFVLGVPLAGIAPLAALAALPARTRWLWGVAGGSLAALLALNAPFLRFLGQERGPLFFLQSCVGVVLDMWASGLGILWAFVTFGRGEQY